MAAGKTMLSVNELAERLGLSRSTVYRRIADRTLPAPIRIGHVLRFRIEDLERWEEWLAEHTQREMA